MSDRRTDERRDGRDSGENEKAMADGGTNRTQQGTRQESRERRPPEEGRASRMGTWFASAAMRWGVILFGIVLMLFALGQAAGTNILGPVIDAMASQTGIWLIVALFALALVAAAGRVR